MANVKINYRDIPSPFDREFGLQNSNKFDDTQEAVYQLEKLIDANNEISRAELIEAKLRILQVLNDDFQAISDKVAEYRKAVFDLGN